MCFNWVVPIAWLSTKVCFSDIKEITKIYSQEEPETMALDGLFSDESKEPEPNFAASRTNLNYFSWNKFLKLKSAKRTHISQRSDQPCNRTQKVDKSNQNHQAESVNSTTLRRSRLSCSLGMPESFCATESLIPAKTPVVIAYSPSTINRRKNTTCFEAESKR